MPTHAAGKFPTDYPAPRKYVLVVSCVDARVLDDLVLFLDHDNLTNRYYHATFAGAALGLTSGLPGGLPDRPGGSFSQWRQTFVEHVRATVALTEGHLTDIYIVQHEDCGAFRLFVAGFAEMSPEEQLSVNRQFASTLLDDLRDNFCTTYNPEGAEDPTGRVQEYRPSIHTFFMDLRGNVERLRSWPEKGEVVDRVCTNYRCQCPEHDEDDGPPDTPKVKPAKKKAKK